MAVSRELEAKRKQLRFASRRLHGVEREADYVELTRIAQYCEQHGIEADGYGEGDELQAFEARVAEMLGYPAARFVPSGTMAQQIAMRIWADGAVSKLIGLHPTSHLLLHEENAAEHLHGLSAVMVGEAHRPMTAADLDGTIPAISALIVELPTRENGGQLAEWDELVSLTSAARERGIATHVDGARLWEAATGYDKPLDEICELFDSAYVSFYKGIGALPGAILAGSQDFIAEAGLWQRRHGGVLYTSIANWLSADMRLDAQLAKMGDYRSRAIEIAAALSAIDGLTLNPSVPQVNMFHVFVQGAEEALLLARDQVAELHDIWIFGGLQATDLPSTYKFEFTVGDAAMNLNLKEIVTALEDLVSHAAVSHAIDGA